MRKQAFIARAALLGVAALALAQPAQAQDCSTLPHPVFVGGSSAVKPVLKALGTQLTATASITLVYQGSASCNGITAFTDATKLKDAASYWDATGAEKSCTVPLDGQAIDIGLSDVFPATCTSNALPATAKEFSGGPVQAMAFVTGAGSSETAISADAAYIALGFGGTDYRVTPWVDPNFFFIRPDTSGTKKMIATAIGLPPAKWNKWWTDMTVQGMHILSKSGDLMAAVAATTNPNATLGILAADWFDDYRVLKDGKQIKVLAFQGQTQSCAYYPDSTSTAYDKLNVREGRYDMWGQLHIVARVGNDGLPASAQISAVVDRLTSKNLSSDDTKTMIDLFTHAHAIPACAMKVTRTAEIGAPVPSTPDVPCGCYFEKVASGAAQNCTVCLDDNACAGVTGAPKCRYGFCEAK
ncbi:MAG: hypothetical protein U1E65_03340 [Myxococcota bacterium]